ncbi:MAG: 5'-3' exonuclease H3TH domain-containing protein [Candidatus Gracilibacteria bacterium]
MATIPLHRNYYVIDGNSYLYRAFFAIPKFSTKDGFVTNAIYGFVKMLLKLMADKHCHEIIVVFDHKGGSFRQEQFVEYKAHREKMPDELIPQIPYIQKFVGLLGLPILVIPGVEADDTIATIACKLRVDDEKHTYIITGDKDMMQLVQHNVFIYDTMKNVIYNREGVKQKMGVYPEQIPDLLGLMGDSADNIPGVPGVGPKTASDLLSKYKNMEEILEHAEEQKGSLKTKLEENREIATLSKQLAIVKCDVEIEHIDLAMTEPQMDEIIKLAKELEFHSLIRELETLAKEHGGTAAEPVHELPSYVKEEMSTESEWKKNLKIFEAASTLYIDCDASTMHMYMTVEGKVYPIDLTDESLRAQVKHFLSQRFENKKESLVCYSTKQFLHFIGTEVKILSKDQMSIF